MITVTIADQLRQFIFSCFYVMPIRRKISFLIYLQSDLQSMGQGESITRSQDHKASLFYIHIIVTFELGTEVLMTISYYYTISMMSAPS